MSGDTTLEGFELPPGKTLEEVRRALISCIRANDADPLNRERVINTRVNVWTSRQAEYTFCASILHDPAKHDMELVCVIPGLKNRLVWMDLIVFLHRADASQEWTVCFVWEGTWADGKRSETRSRSEVDTIKEALNALPLLLERELNH